MALPPELYLQIVEVLATPTNPFAYGYQSDVQRALLQLSLTSNRFYALAGAKLYSSVVLSKNQALSYYIRTCEQTPIAEQLHSMSLRILPTSNDEAVLADIYALMHILQYAPNLRRLDFSLSLIICDPDSTKILNEINWILEGFHRLEEVLNIDGRLVLDYPQKLKSWQPRLQMSDGSSLRRAIFRYPIRVDSDFARSFWNASDMQTLVLLWPIFEPGGWDLLFRQPSPPNFVSYTRRMRRVILLGKCQGDGPSPEEIVNFSNDEYEVIYAATDLNRNNRLPLSTAPSVQDQLLEWVATVARDGTLWDMNGETIERSVGSVWRSHS